MGARYTYFAGIRPSFFGSTDWKECRIGRMPGARRVHLVYDFSLRFALEGFFEAVVFGFAAPRSSK